jgi:nitrogen fixation protein
MSSAAAAVEGEAFVRLDEGVTLATVFQDVPEDTPPPVVILGDISAVPFTDDPNDPDRRVTLTITTVTAGEERLPCTDIQDEVEAALGSVRATRDGWELAFRSLGSDAALIGDASGYAGTTTFEIIAFKQD